MTFSLKTKSKASISVHCPIRRERIAQTSAVEVNDYSGC